MGASSGDCWSAGTSSRCAPRSSAPSSSSGPWTFADLPLLLLSIPLWVLLAYGHRLYHLDSYRADYGAADEIGPVLQMATLWSWSMLLALSAVHPDHVPVSQMALFWALTLILPMALRSASRAFARRQVWYLQNAIDRRTR